MTRYVDRLRLASGAVALMMTAVSAQQALPPTWNNIYSAAQAKRGEAAYGQMCAACHGADLHGTDRAPGIAGAELAAHWGRKPLGDLLGYMQATMPLYGPGGLTRHKQADILAFMLQRSGASAGAQDLWIDGVEGGAAPPRRSADYAQIAKPSTKRGEAFYTAEQAERGRAAFNRNCLFCHSMDPKLSTPEDLQKPMPSTLGGHFIERVVNDLTVYPNVLALYSKFKSMPGINTKTVSDQQRVDIAAYVLQQNGLPAGSDEIPTNIDAMRLMMINEPGFERIFNGKDLAGWNILLGPNCPYTGDTCAQTEPLDVLRVNNQTIVCECHVHGHLYTDKKYKDFTLRFDTKFERPAEFAPEDNEELFSGGGGYKIFTEFGGRFPKYIEVEGRHRDMLDLVAGGQRIGTVDAAARRRAMRPLGQWNSIEITAKNGAVQVTLNGVLVSSVQKHDFNYAGHIMFQSQGAKMYWRNIRIKVE
jgi:cytochrome c